MWPWRVAVRQCHRNSPLVVAPAGVGSATEQTAAAPDSWQPVCRMGAGVAADLPSLPKIRCADTLQAGSMASARAQAVNHWWGRVCSAWHTRFCCAVYSQFGPVVFEPGPCLQAERPTIRINHITGWPSNASSTLRTTHLIYFKTQCVFNANKK